MNPQTQSIAIASLELDGQNPRLPHKQENTQAAILTLFQRKGPQMLAMCEDIATHGVDPLTNIAVVPSGRTAEYIVHEGNRRVAALKVLETPSIVQGVLAEKDYRRLKNASAKYSTTPISAVDCKVFQSERDLDHWKRLRHTGMNNGAGLVEWGSDEQDRYNATRSVRSPAGQILDYLRAAGHEVVLGKVRDGVITSLTRMISTPDVRNTLGISIQDGIVYSVGPGEHAVKRLAYLVDKIASGQLKVKDIYTADQRKAFAASIPDEYRPDISSSDGLPTRLDGKVSPAQESIRPPRKPSRKIIVSERKALVPSTLSMVIGNTRIATIFGELKILQVDRHNNACAVLLRVFVELSVDDRLLKDKAMSDADRRSKPLAHRMRLLATHLHARGEIDADLKDHIIKIADNDKGVLYASTPTFNMYVHSRWLHPKPTDLLRSWDDLQPFIEVIWR